MAIEKAMENRRLRNELASLRQHVAWEFGYDNITGDSNALRHVKDTVARLSETDLPVLITGEPGVGKELFAKAVHFHSRRRKSPLMTINCSTHPTNLIDSELFGASRSLYSSTTLTKRGLLEQADGGAIIIDEIAKLPLESQTKLMRVIDNSEITTTGPGATRKVHVRIIATTSHDLARDVADGAFREDLYARLKSVPLHIPALRDRKEDIPLLVERFLRSTHSDKTAAGESLRLSRPALEKLIAHNWPGNVRELESTIRRARALARNAEISADDIFFVSSPMISPKPAIIVATTETAGDTIAGERGSLELTFRNRIIKSLEDNDWNFTQTATELGIGRTTLWRKVKKYNLKRELIQS